VDDKKTYIKGDLETQKFSHRQDTYKQGMKFIEDGGYGLDDLIHHFPAFTGHMTLSRFLTMYEVYKMVHCRYPNI